MSSPMCLPGQDTAAFVGADLRVGTGDFSTCATPLRARPHICHSELARNLPQAVQE